MLAEAQGVNICELVARLPLYIGCTWLSGTASFLWSYSVNQKRLLLMGHKLISMFEKNPLHPVLDLHNLNIMKYWLDQDISKMKIMTCLYFIHLLIRSMEESIYLFVLKLISPFLTFCVTVVLVYEGILIQVFVICSLFIPVFMYTWQPNNRGTSSWLV
jgi:hypothetical protein